MPELEKSPSTADRALLRAFRAWGGLDSASSKECYSADWHDRLFPHRVTATRERPDAAWAVLPFDQEVAEGPDLSRVHPSWFIRALASESPAVRQAVVAHAPRAFRDAIRQGLGITAADLPTDCPPDAHFQGWARSFWTERLVGDVVDRDDDLPVVLAMTRLSATDLGRLVKVCGLAKHAFALQHFPLAEADEQAARFSQLDRVRIGYFRRHIGKPDPRLVPLARQDLLTVANHHRQAHSRLGLLTFGRLLSGADPLRGRWALQHLPYTIAKRMRVKTCPGLPRKAMRAWETWVFEAAWSRLFNEGRIAAERGTEPVL